MRKQRLHAIILFVLFMMLCACAAAEGRVVRVAFLEQEGMSFIGHTGKITGYNFDYLEKISEYTGWQIEYVTYPTADYNEVVGHRGFAGGQGGSVRPDAQDFAVAGRV